MGKSKRVSGWAWLHRGKLIAGSIIAITAAAAAVAGPAIRYIHHSAAQDVQVDANTKAIDAITAKLDKVAADTAEIKGSVNTLLRITRDRDREASEPEDAGEIATK
jgi:hypothetical protein